MKGKSVIENILTLAEPLAKGMGFEILLIEEISDFGKRTFRIYLDKPEADSGVTIDDCAEFSRALDPVLDVEGGLEGRYNLEISSPGLNRPLVKVEHFKAHLGKIIQVTTREEIEGRHKFKGELIKVLGEESPPVFEILVDMRIFSIPFDCVKKASFDFFATEEKKIGSKKKFKTKKR